MSQRLHLVPCVGSSVHLKSPGKDRSSIIRSSLIIEVENTSKLPWPPWKLNLTSSASQMRPPEMFASKDSDVMKQEREIKQRDMEEASFSRHISDVATRYGIWCSVTVASVGLPSVRL